RLASVVGTGLVAMIGVCAFLVLAGAGLAILMPLILSLEKDVGARLTLAFFVSAAGIAGQLAVFGAANVLNALQRPVAAGISRNFADAASLMLTVVLLLRGGGLMAIAWGFVARTVLDGAVVAIAFRRIWRSDVGERLRFERRQAADLFKL